MISYTKELLYHNVVHKILSLDLNNILMNDMSCCKENNIYKMNQIFQETCEVSKYIASTSLLF